MDSHKKIIVSSQPFIEYVMDTLLESGKGHFPPVLYVGARGSGRKSYIYWFINQVSGNTESPDILHLKGTEKVDEFKGAIDEFTSHYPVELNFRWLILENMDWYPWKTLNSALKIIEEPAQHLAIIGMTEDFEYLPPAIRSRMMSFKFGHIAPHDMTAILERDSKLRPLAAIVNKYPFKSIWQLVTYRSMDFEGFFEKMCITPQYLNQVHIAFKEFEQRIKESGDRAKDIWHFFLEFVAHKVSFSSEERGSNYKKSIQILLQSTAETLFRYLKHPHSHFMLTQKGQLRSFFNMFFLLKGRQC